MVHVVLLAGGVGRRMGLSIPKQYVIVKGIPVFLYSFRKLVSHPSVSDIVMVVSGEWTQFVQEWIEKEHVHKPIFYASSGMSREHSVLNGLLALKAMAKKDDLVLVHDSVRPFFPDSNVTDGIECCKLYDASLPAIAVKDATYQSYDGNELSLILPREQLFSGQSPECFRFFKFLEAHENLSDEEISGIRGSSELAFKNGMKVKMIQGSEQNIKLTTIKDLNFFESSFNTSGKRP